MQQWASGILRVTCSSLGMVAATFLACPADAITVQTTADYSRTLANGRFSGVGSMGRLPSNSTGGVQFGHGCTGSLVATNVVLTAAHCLDNDKFSLPAAGDLNIGTLGDIYNIVDSKVLPFYYDNTKSSDLALVKLDRHVFDREIYGVYDQQDEIGQVMTTVGAGLTGLLESGVDYGVSDFKLRFGENRFDATYADVLKRIYTLYGYDFRPADADDRLVYDFDNGLAANDSFGRYLGVNDLGVRDSTGFLTEVGVGYGDSGGPDFLRGKIAGVHSGLGAGAYLEKTDATGCGTNGSSDYARPGRFSCFDASWGDWSITTRVSYYADPIRAYIASAVPESSTWSMMIVGFGAIGIAIRRRRQGVPDRDYRSNGRAKSRRRNRHARQSWSAQL